MRGWVPFLRQGPSFLWVNRREDMSVVGEETGRSLVWGDLFLRCHSEPAAFWPCEESAVRLSGVLLALPFGFGNQSAARSFQRGLLRCISHSFLSRRQALICFSRAMARRMSPNIS